MASTSSSTIASQSIFERLTNEYQQTYNEHGLNCPILSMTDSNVDEDGDLIIGNSPGICLRRSIASDSNKVIVFFFFIRNVEVAIRIGIKANNQPIPKYVTLLADDGVCQWLSYRRKGAPNSTIINEDLIVKECDVVAICINAKKGIATYTIVRDKYGSAIKRGVLNGELQRSAGVSYQPVIKLQCPGDAVQFAEVCDYTDVCNVESDKNKNSTKK
mmetsp:Transcript_5053/g.4421  ORF Transcript_5053/g.4421 Transcript_5053/m.4421 type:complete len:216 (-) Transcript_5053:363-1010(-)